MPRFVLIVLLLALHAQIAVSQPVVAAAPSPSPALKRLARQVEPDLVGRVDRLPQYVEFFRSKLANDTRLFAFDVKATQAGPGRVSLRGYVEFPEIRAGLVGFLAALGFDVVDAQLQSLPSEKLGKKAFGLVKATHTLSYDSPDGERSVVTDCLLGERLFLLRAQGDHLLVHSGEGYLGYVAAADVHRVDAAAFARYPSDSAVRLTTNHKLESGLILPTGAVLKALPNEGPQVLVALPTGATAEIPQGVCKRVTAPSEEIERAIAVGKQMLGTPYYWGGKTSEGIDCSGLVQVAFATSGVRLPRDSNQQFLVGELSGTRWNRDGLRRGDSLYFLGQNGRIRHTGIYLGGHRFLHAIRPVVTIGSFNPEHEDYDPKRAASFAFGKRPWQ